MNYVIRLNSEGYYGRTPYTPVPRTQATIFASMKKARAALNRLRGRVFKDHAATTEIEPL